MLGFPRRWSPAIRSHWTLCTEFCYSMQRSCLGFARDTRDVACHKEILGILQCAGVKSRTKKLYVLKGPPALDSRRIAKGVHRLYSFLQLFRDTPEHTPPGCPNTVVVTIHMLFSHTCTLAWPPLPLFCSIQTVRSCLYLPHPAYLYPFRVCPSLLWLYYYT